MAPTSPGGVQVVAAGMADPVDAGGEGQPGALADGQGIEVGAQRDPVCRLLGPEVGEQPRAGQPADGDAGPLETLGDDARRAGLLAGELGVGVQVVPERDELVGDRGDAGPEVGEQGVISHLSPHLTRAPAPPTPAVTARGVGGQAVAAGGSPSTRVARWRSQRSTMPDISPLTKRRNSRLRAIRALAWGRPSIDPTPSARAAVIGA